jgi:T-lymphoma invasion and metastasis-inducing protein 1
MKEPFPSLSDKDQPALSPDGDSTAPPSQCSDQPPQSSVVPPPVPLHRVVAPAVQQQARPEPRGRGGGTGCLVGDQPPLDVDALLRRHQEEAAAPPPSASAAATLSPSSSQPQLTPTRVLSDAERLRKVVCELVETEDTYVRHLGYLIKTYLEPLRREAFLSNAEMSTLFGNIQEIHGFQTQFLAALEDAVATEREFNRLEKTSQFKVKCC